MKSIDDRISEFKENSESIDKTRLWLEEIYEDERITTAFQKPFISSLISACDYLTSNLEILRRKVMQE